MTLEIDVNETRKDVMINFLDIFKKDNLIKDYKVKYNKYENELIQDIEKLKSTLLDAKDNKGFHTEKSIEIK